MVAPAARDIDLFNIAGRSISGWIPSFKTGMPSYTRQPFCSQLEERLLLYLEYHPQVKGYARGDIGPQIAATYRLPIPQNAPFDIGYEFLGRPHDYLPAVVGARSKGTWFITEARAESARRLARIQRGVFWIGTERTLRIIDGAGPSIEAQESESAAQERMSGTGSCAGKRSAEYDGNGGNVERTSARYYPGRGSGGCWR